jgi:hypothetical protein
MIKKWAANSAVPRGSVVLTEIAGLARQSQRAALAMLEVAIPTVALIGIFNDGLPQLARLVSSGRWTGMA